MNTGGHWDVLLGVGEDGVHDVVGEPGQDVLLTQVVWRVLLDLVSTVLNFPLAR